MAHTKEKIEARRRYVEDGETIEAIARALAVPEKTLYRWRSEGNWEKEREAMEMTGTTALKATLQLAIKQLQEMAVSGVIDARKADALNKIIKSAKSLARDIDKRGNILLGMAEFVEYLRDHHADLLEKIHPVLGDFGTWVKRKYPA